MKNLSASNLLKLAVTGQHLPYCPNQSTSVSVTNCKCWKFEVNKWNNRIITKPKKRLLKLHYISAQCGAKGFKNETDKALEVTCKHCIAIISKRTFPKSAINT